MTSFWLPDETGFSYRNGALFCEDVPVTELADKYGTPSFIYSRKAIETAFREEAHRSRGYRLWCVYSV